MPQDVLRYFKKCKTTSGEFKKIFKVIRKKMCTTVHESRTLKIKISKLTLITFSNTKVAQFCKI